MSLAQSNLALGAVTRLVQDRLTMWMGGLHVTATRPERAATTDSNPKLNLFLYETNFDASLRNVPLDQGRPPPLWFVLKYLLTAFDAGGDSDSPAAHELLGRGLSALQELAYLPINGASLTDQQALHKNPEPLKITFDEITAELISKLMQGSDEKYRLSIGFQVRPVMIAPPEPPSYALLVGINYTNSPATVRPDESRTIAVLPSLGTSLDEVIPAQFEVKSPPSTVLLTGRDLNVSGLKVFLGPAELTVVPPITAAALKCRVNGAIATGTILSAGSHPLFVQQVLPGNRKRTSNLLVGNLLPTLDSASLPSPGVVRLQGNLLGSSSDDILIAFYQSGSVERLFDAGILSNASQTQLDLTVSSTPALPPGSYRIILRVNGQQARNSPTVTWP
jgi:uncharacterized protein DUF4255